MYLTDFDTIKKCWYCPDTDTDTRIGAALQYGNLYNYLSITSLFHDTRASISVFHEILAITELNVTFDVNKIMDH